MKTLQELISIEDSAWLLLLEWLKTAKNQYEVYPKQPQNAERELLEAQISTKSYLGAVLYETGGILIDNGWLRILGSGCESFGRSLIQWNKNKPYFLIADDISGGFFALNNGVWGEDVGKVYYFAPDTLAWEPLDFSYGDFLYWTLHGDISLFYESFRWKKWREDIPNITTDQIVSFFPFLWTKYDDFEQISRKIIPIEEYFELMINF